MLIWDNYKVSVTKSIPCAQTHSSDKQSPKLLRGWSDLIEERSGNCKAPLSHSLLCGVHNNLQTAKLCIEQISCWMNF